MTGPTVDVLVIGGGVIGTSILAECAARGFDSMLIEAGADVGEGASRANSAIVHTGFDATPNSTEARHLRRAGELWPERLEDLGVPFLAVGALMLARTTEEHERLITEVAVRAAANGVVSEMLPGDALREVAPYVAPDVIAALSIPAEGVIDPFWLTRANAEAAITAGAIVRTSCSSVAIRVGLDAVVVETADGARMRARQVIDAAGLQADDVARSAGDDSFLITPRRGQFVVSEETYGVDRIVLPIPGPMGKGMLLTPIVFGGLLLGPTAVDGDDKEDRSTSPDETARIMAACRVMVPAVEAMRPIRAFTGLRTVSSTGDYILRPSIAGDRLFLAAGIRSTGISASPSIAESVVDAVVALRGWGFRPRTRVRPAEASFPDEAGAIVCLCRSIGRGEVQTACDRPLPPTTVDALKRRGGVTFGDCQGNLCLVDVATTLAAANGVPVTAIEKGARGSWLFRRPSERRTDAAARAARPGGGDGSPDALPGFGVDGLADLDVVVIGNGRAGGASAAVLHEHGLRVRSLDRRAGATAVGLIDTDKGWRVEVASDDGAISYDARAVLLATGGFVEPREHRPIAGPRPAGVVTADLVERAIGAGLVPGSVVVVVGTGPRAATVVADLEAAGCRTIPLVKPPLTIRGHARLEAVEAERGTWIQADTLVLADRQSPQPFLLRALGLIDGRPGVVAPADAAGLVAPGLWATGCCARPDVDHIGCADDGRRVAVNLAASLLDDRVVAGWSEPVPR